VRSEESLCSQGGPTIGEGHWGRREPQERQRETTVPGKYVIQKKSFSVVRYVVSPVGPWHFRARYHETCLFTYFITLLLLGVRSVVMSVSVCLSVCPLAYIKTSQNFLYMLPVAMVRYWHGYLSGARCKWFPYGPADATTTSSSLAPVKYRMVSLSGAGLPRLSWKKGRLMDVECSSSYLSPWLGSPLTTMQYFVYFQFYGLCNVCP